MRRIAFNTGDTNFVLEIETSYSRKNAQAIEQSAPEFSRESSVSAAANMTSSPPVKSLIHYRRKWLLSNELIAEFHLDI